MSKLLDKESFLKDVSNHKMEVLLDDGVNRHLKFSRPGDSTMYFSLTTWKHYLCISGDMGNYVFTRLPDMFNFFRRDELSINSGYWHEKLESIDRRCGSRKFDEEKFKAEILKIVNEWEFSDEEEDRRHCLEQLEDEVFSCRHDGEVRAREAAESFEYIDSEDNKFSLADAELWEYDFREYTFNFIWCLFAIVWGIQQYDEFKGMFNEEYSNAEVVYVASEEAMKAIESLKEGGDV